jgi:hypothetical protein
MGWIGSVAGGSPRARAKLWLTVGAGVAGAVVVTAGVIAAVTGFGSHQQAAAGPQTARHYLNASACLLTDPSGITPGASGAPAWKAMQTASLATHVMVSYLPDTGPATASDMLGTLMERKCGVIIATGAAAGEVVRAAKADRHQEFVLVAAPGVASPRGMPNLVVVSAAGAPVRIDQAIRALASQAQSPHT